MSGHGRLSSYCLGLGVADSVTLARRLYLSGPLKIQKKTYPQKFEALKPSLTFRIGLAKPQTWTLTLKDSHSALRRLHVREGGDDQPERIAQILVALD